MLKPRTRPVEIGELKVLAPLVEGVVLLLRIRQSNSAGREDFVAQTHIVFLVAKAKRISLASPITDGEEVRRC